MSDGDLIYIPSQEDLPLPLGRSLVWHDPRNRNFRALDRPLRLPHDPKQPWYTRDVFDQLGPSCTAAAAVGVLRTSPFRDLMKSHWTGYDTEQERHDLYKLAQQHDPWEGEAYEGSSTDAPFKVLRNAGIIQEWRWLFGLAEVRQWLKEDGACAVGTNWYRSMFSPDNNGTIHIRDEEGVAGGHAYRLVYYDEDDKRYRKVGSWGRPWGDNGRAWIEEEDLERLLEEQGEAVTVVI